MLNELHCADCAKYMNGQMAADSVDMILTSPPYDSIRTYGDKSEWTFDKFKTVAAGIQRILKPGGTMVWIVGDMVKDMSETLTAFRQALYFRELGLVHYDTMIWKKACSNPPQRRYGQDFEYMFVISNGRPKTVNLIADKRNKYAGDRPGRTQHRKADGTKVAYFHDKPLKEFGVRGNIWEYANGYNQGQKFNRAYEHPATMPEPLAKDLIISFSNENDLIYDPFAGSGTTRRMARATRRSFIGTEINSDYCALANDLNEQQGSLL